MNGTGPLDFEATIDSAQFNGALDEMSRRIRGTSDTIVKEGIRMDETFRKAAIALGSYFTFQQAKQLVTEIANVRGEFQQLGIAFEVMLDSKEKSDKLMKEQIILSQKSPFTLLDVATNTKQLMAMGVAYEDVMATMKALGDVAAGVSVPISRVAINYGQVMTLGKLQEREVRDFAMAGIPLIEELAKNLGKSKQEIMGMISESQIAATDVTKAFQTMSGEGGKFFNLMEKQNASITGQISNLQDKIQIMLNEIGKSNEGLIYGSIKGATTLVQNYEEVGKVLISIAAIIGTAKAAEIAYITVLKVGTLIKLESALAERSLTVAEGLHAIALKKVSAAQLFLNKTMLANPYVLAATALTTLAAAIWIFHDSTSHSEKVMKRFNDEREKMISLETEHKARIDDLISVVTDNAEAENKRINALMELKRLYPAIFNQYDIETLKLDELLKAKNLLNEAYAKGSVEQAKEASIKNTSTISILEKQLADLRKQGISDSSEEIKQLVSRLEDERMIRSKYNEIIQKDAIASFVAGLDKMSIIELQNELAVRNQAIQKANNIPFPTNQFVDGNIAGMYNVDQIKEQTKALEIELAKRNEATFTFKELQIKYTDELKAAEKELIDLKTKKLPIDQWNEEFERINAKIKSAKANLEALNGKQKTDKKHKKTPEELAAEQLQAQTELVSNLIEEAKKKYTDLGDYIIFLRSEIRKSIEAPESDFNTVKIGELYSELVNTEKEYLKRSEETYKTLIGQSKNYTQKRINAEKEYQAEVSKLDKKTLGEQKYNDAVQVAKDILKEKLDLINEEEIKTSEAYKSIAGNLDELSRGAAKRYLQVLKDQLETLKGQPELYAEIKRLIKATEETLNNKTAKGINEIADGFGEASQLVRLFDEDLANTVETIGSVVSGVARIAAGDTIGGILQIGTSIFSAIINSSENAARKAQERQQVILDALNERLSNINTLLERQISLVDELSGSEKLIAYSDSFAAMGEEIVNTIDEIDRLTSSLNQYRAQIEYDYMSGQFYVGDSGAVTNYQEMTGVDNGIYGIDPKNIQSLIDKNKGNLDILYKELLAGNLGDKTEEVKALIDNLEEQTQMFEELKAQYNEYITGTNVASIVDTIAAGFEEGKRSAEDFADTFEDLMRKAILQGIKIKLLEEPLKKWYDEFALANEDGLTEAESAHFLSWYNSIATNAGKAYDDATAFLGDNAIDIAESVQADTTLAGAIKGVTQETASIIAGQMNAIRMNQAQSLGIMNEQLMQLSEIATNTRYNRRLELLVDIKNILQGNSINQINATRSQGLT
jgi:tape measure domain-containing protein